MRIVIDTEVCIGAGQCVLSAPETFTQDDDGFSEVRPGAHPDSPRLSLAIQSCPVGAISLREE
ncbi:ferredoxin [Streptomyces sp. NPDC087440]|uniref:ferredoxin n=1 Tax=Streptomyces sp. NPDC087440 TaxID=3365790 RepID=UPI0038089A6E